MLKQLPLVGRQEEISELRQRLSAAAAGSGGLVLLGGEAGIGKSALLRAFASEAHGQNYGVGRCLGGLETPPYGPWLEVFEELAAQAGIPRTQLPPPFGETAGEWTAATVAAALSAWLADAARAGSAVLVALEDIHWADPASLQLLEYMAPRLGRTPVLVVATYRNDELSRPDPLWRLLPDLQRSGAVRMSLPRLNATAVAELAEAVLPDSPARADLTLRLHQRTGGHPLFVRELLEAAARSGGTFREDEPLPETVQQAIDRRLMRLSPGAERVLEAAAVIGERFGYTLLSQVANVSEDELAAALDEALSLRVIRTEDISGDQFSFDHSLVRDTFLGRLIGLRRRRCHLAVADALLQNPNVDPDTVAWHLGRAGDPRAVDYLFLALNRSLRLGSLIQAEQLALKTLEILPAADPRRGELLLKLGRSFRGEYDRARAYWEEAVKAAESCGDKPVATWGRHFLAQWHSYRRDPESLDLMAEVQSQQEELLGDARYQQLEIDLTGQIHGYPPIAGLRAWALTLAGHLAEAQSLTAQLRARSLPGSRMADILNVEAYLCMYTGRTREAMTLYRQAAREAVLLKDYRNAMRHKWTEMMTMIWCAPDRPDELDAVAAEVAELEVEARQRAGYSGTPEGFSCLGSYQFLRGDWDGARQNLLIYLNQYQDQIEREWCRWFGAHLQQAVGDWTGARAIMAPVRPQHPDEDLGFHPIQVLSLCVRAETELAEGNIAGARSWLEAADRHLDERTLVPMRACVRLGWAALHRASGDLDAAWQEAGRALDYASQSQDGWHMVEAHRLLGQLAAELGRPGEADQHLQTALDLADRCRLPYELALTQLVRAQVLPHAPGAHEGLLAATDTFARLGAAPALAAAKACLPSHTGVSLLVTRGPGEALPSPVSAPLPDGLSEREVSVIRLVANGMTDKEVGAQLYITPKTVQAHLRNIFNKVGVSNRAALTAYAARHDLL